MAPDPDSEPRGRRAYRPGSSVGPKGIACEKCGGLVYEGDWPAGWCKGDPREHER